VFGFACFGRAAEPVLNGGGRGVVADFHQGFMSGGAAFWGLLGLAGRGDISVGCPIARLNGDLTSDGQPSVLDRECDFRKIGMYRGEATMSSAVVVTYAKPTGGASTIGVYRWGIGVLKIFGVMVSLILLSPLVPLVGLMHILAWLDAK
jgi:hypothetical protein